MITTKNARRITIVLDAALKDIVFEKVQQLGATCFNYNECSGQGHHAVTGNPYSGEGLLRMEIVTTPTTGAKLLDWIHAAQFAQLSHYALFAFADTVEVDERDQSVTKLG